MAIRDHDNRFYPEEIRLFPQPPYKTNTDQYAQILELQRKNDRLALENDVLREDADIKDTMIDRLTNCLFSREEEIQELSDKVDDLTKEKYSVSLYEKG